MSVFYDLSKTPRNILNQAIVRAIVSENNGALFDPSDLSTLYQDAAGTIPVTAVEQPVGKMLDKSGNGYHATQSITASRPVLSARYNLLTKTEDFSDAVWITSTEGASVVAPSKNNIRESGSGAVMHRARYLYSDVVIGAPHTFSFKFKPAGLRYCAIRGSSVGGNTQIGFDLQTKAVTFASAGRSGEVTYDGDGYVIISCSFSPVTASVSESLAFSTTQIIDNTLPQHVADITRGVDDLRASLTQSNARLQYQRVNTATDYDTDERYFKKYLRFDGVDDYLVLPYRGLYAAGSASIVSALSDGVLSGASRSLVTESNTTTGASIYQHARTATGPNIRKEDGVIVLADKVRDSNPVVGIITSIDTGSSLSLYKDTMYKNSYPYARSGPLILTNTILCALVRLTIGDYFNGRLYGLIITKSALTDSQRIACERYLGRKSGVQL